MRIDPDLPSVVRSWLDLGADRLPDRTLDRVLEAVPTTPQRRPTWPPRRFHTMSTTIRAVVGATVLVVALVVGVQIVGSGTGSGATPIATASAAATAPATVGPTTEAASPDATGPTADTLTAANLGAPLKAGTYMPDVFGKGMLITIPDGFQLEALNEGNVAFSWPHGYLGVFLPQAVFADPCHPAAEAVAATTGDELVALLTTMKGFTAAPVTETKISGRRARMFQLSNDIDTTAAGCTRDAMLPLFTYTTHPEGAQTNGKTRQLVWVVDGQAKDGLLRNAYAGPILVVADSWATDAELEILTRIAESIEV